MAGAALVAGLLLRLWFVNHMTRIDGDSLMYGDIARNWLQHGVYGFTESGHKPGSIEIRPTLIRLPGYPLFLAACFRLFGMEDYRAVVYVQAAVDLGTCWLVSALAGRLFGSRAMLPVLWLAALCPFTANYVATPLTETLVLTSIALAFYGFVRWQDAGIGINRWLWVVAAALASSILLRPEQGLLAAAVLPAMFCRCRVARVGDGLRMALPSLAAALCVLLPLLPWTMRNWQTFHVFQPLTPRYANDPGELPPVGFGRWYRTWAIDFASTVEVYWSYSGERIDMEDLPARALGHSQELEARTVALIEDYNATTGVTTSVVPAIDARFDALAHERIHAHPILYYAGLPGTRLLDMILRPRTEMMDIPLAWWQWKEHRARTAFATSYAVLNLAYIGLGVAGFYIWKGRSWSLCSPTPASSLAFRELVYAMAASLILRSALLLTLDNSEPRYTLEFFPVLFVWAGALFANPANTPSGEPAAIDELAQPTT